MIRHNSLALGQDLLRKALADFRESVKNNKRDAWLLDSDMFGAEATFETLQYAIQKAETDRHNRENKVCAMFHRFCGTLDSHSALFSVIPSQNQYCSLFCGAISIIVKVSIGVPKTTELKLMTRHP
jgi:hypothetical protein